MPRFSNLYETAREHPTNDANNIYLGDREAPRSAQDSKAPGPQARPTPIPTASW